MAQLQRWFQFFPQLKVVLVVAVKLSKGANVVKEAEIL